VSERVFERANQHHGAEGSLVRHQVMLDFVVRSGTVHQ